MCRFSQDCHVRIQSPQIWLSISIANNCSTSTNHHYHPLPPLTISTNLHCHHQPWQLPTKYNHQRPPLITNHYLQQYLSTITTTTNYDNYQSIPSTTTTITCYKPPLLPPSALMTQPVTTVTITTHYLQPPSHVGVNRRWCWSGESHGQQKADVRQLRDGLILTAWGQSRANKEDRDQKILETA